MVFLCLSLHYFVLLYVWYMYMYMIGYLPLSLFHHIPLRKNLPLRWNLFWLDWLATKPWESACLCLPLAGVRGICSLTQLCV